jgi:hypothetical protein
MRILSQGACPSPKCNSSDAYTEYDDGHGWCFSCHYYKPAKTTSLQQVTNTLFKQSQETNVNLPSDFDKNIPVIPLTWLKKYGLTSDEIDKAEWGWSESTQMLIIPFFDGEYNVIGWQGRYFPTQKVKCYTEGNVNDILALFESDVQSDAVCVVEDCVSAVKVSRYVDSVALLGSHLSLTKAVRLSRLYRNLYIWLDSDKVKEAHKFQQRYKSLFDNVFVIFTKLDPKENTYKDIKEALDANV